MAVIVEKDGTLKYDKWYTAGGSMYSVNRDCLSPDDPNHTYNYLTANGVVPEEYGIQHPYVEEFKEYTRGQLIDEIMKLRKELEYNHFYGFGG